MRIGVYGTGRFGSFWASLLARRAQVLCYNRSNRPPPQGATTASEEDVLAADALFLCVTISAFGEVVERIAPRLGENTVVMDTCSVKVHPTRLMAQRIGSPQRCLGTHPMFGPDSAAQGVAGLPIVLTPRSTSPQIVEQWHQIFSDLGLAVSVMSPDEHDREAAFSQGVTHFVGRLLADLELSPSPIGTVGYQKLLEVVGQTCNDPYQLFLDLQRYNPHTSEMRSRLRASVDRLLLTLDSEKSPD